MKEKTTKKKKKGTGKFLVILLILLIIVAGTLLAMKIVKDKQAIDTQNGDVEEDSTIVVPIEEEKIKIYAGNERPIAIMIDNVGEALPQVSLNKAYLVYEIIVEGGLTRLMPVYKGADLEKVGPVRSARHYFLDYALENDAIMVHYGESPKAKQDIKSLKIDDVDGIYDTCLWRVKDKNSPHNAVTSTEKLNATIKNKKYRTNSNKDSILNYVAKEMELTEGTIANTVTIPYPSQKTKYVYDAEKKVYNRYSNGKQQLDWVTKEPVYTKNIIITFAKNTTLNDGENKDRQNLSNIGTLKGYYITNGKAIPITCEKEARTKQTVYKDANGKEIDVNDGNTYIQICPIDANVTME